ncbi:MAG: hypothetical protein AAF192_13240, partial [Pseudomonadota bacterium]
MATSDIMTGLARNSLADAPARGGRGASSGGRSSGDGGGGGGRGRLARVTALALIFLCGLLGAARLDGALATLSGALALGALVGGLAAGGLIGGGPFRRVAGRRRQGRAFLALRGDDPLPRALTDADGRIVQLNAALACMAPALAPGGFIEDAAEDPQGEDAGRVYRLLRTAGGGRAAREDRLRLGGEPRVIFAEPMGRGLVEWRFDPCEAKPPAEVLDALDLLAAPAAALPEAGGRPNAAALAALPALEARLGAGEAL